MTTPEEIKTEMNELFVTNEHEAWVIVNSLLPVEDRLYTLATLVPDGDKGIMASTLEKFSQLAMTFADAWVTQPYYGYTLEIVRWKSWDEVLEVYIHRECRRREYNEREGRFSDPQTNELAS